MRYDIESCDQGGEDQDKTWLDGPVASVKGKSKALELAHWSKGDEVRSENELVVKMLASVN